MRKSPTAELAPAQPMPTNLGPQAEQPTDAPGVYVSEYLAVFDAVRATLDGGKAASHRARSAPQATIVGHGVAANALPDDTQLATVVNPRSGTIAMSTGSRLGTQAAVQGFERAMYHQGAVRASTRGAGHAVARTLRDAVPAVIQDARQRMGSPAEPAPADTAVVQIARGNLVFSSEKPLFVYNEGYKDGKCERLAYKGIVENGSHKLRPGRTIVVICDMDGERDVASTLAVEAGIYQEFNPPSPVPGKRRRRPDGDPSADAGRIAARVQAALKAKGTPGTVMVSIIDVPEGRARRAPTRALPEQPSAPVARAAARPALAAASAAAAEAEPPPSVLAAPNKAPGRRPWAGSMLGKAAALATLAGTMASVLAPGAAPARAEGLHSNALKPDKDNVLHLPGYRVNSAPDSTLHILRPVAFELPTPAELAVPDIYTALARDLANHNQPSNLWNMYGQAMQESGERAGLPQNVIDDMKHNARLVKQFITVFVADTHDRHNRRARYAQHELNAGHTYSMVNGKQYTDALATDKARSLGLAPPRQEPAVQQPIAPPPVTQAPMPSASQLPAASAPIGSDRLGNIANTLMLTGMVGLTIAALGYVVVRNRRRSPNLAIAGRQPIAVGPAPERPNSKAARQLGPDVWTGGNHTHTPAALPAAAAPAAISGTIMPPGAKGRVPAVALGPTLQRSAPAAVPEPDDATWLRPDVSPRNGRPIVQHKARWRNRRTRIYVEDVVGKIPKQPRRESRRNRHQAIRDEREVQRSVDD